MKVKDYVDPFSSQIHEIAKKFDMATIENKIEDICKLLAEAESLLDTQNRASQAQLYYSMRWMGWMSTKRIWRLSGKILIWIR